MNKFLWAIAIIFCFVGATATIVPDSESVMQWTGAYTDIDEGTDSPNDSDFVTTDSSGNQMRFGLGNPGIVDADTVTNIDIIVRANDNDSSNRLDVRFLIGGVSQGAYNVNTSTTIADYTCSNAGWDSDWTESQLNGAELQIFSDDTGPEGDYWIYAVQVEITYTEGATGSENVVRMII